MPIISACRAAFKQVVEYGTHKIKSKLSSGPQHSEGLHYTDAEQRAIAEHPQSGGW